MLNLNQLTPYIRVAGDSILEPGWRLKERVIFDYELLYVKNGRALVSIEGNEFLAEAGDIVLFKPSQRHSFIVAEDMPLSQPHIHFDLYYRPDSEEVKVSFKSFEELTEQEKGWLREDELSTPPFDFPNHIRLRNPLAFEKILFDIIKEYEIRMPFFETNVKGVFIQLLVYLIREQYWKSRPHVYTNLEDLIRIQNYLNHNTDREVHLDELAKYSNISKYYLIRLFKNAFGMSPIHYHQLVRVKAAKEMIQFTRIPLTEIAERLGFQSIHSFSRAFKNIEGCSPSFYRKREGSAE